mmetsp:Transcript_1018/g.2970  ORF Transcript_1018/g.2970 Transcript_1018/m.2970 type:complete len:546 (-) Transcript_1018:297-1934(-)
MGCARSIPVQPGGHHPTASQQPSTNQCGDGLEGFHNGYSHTNSNANDGVDCKEAKHGRRGVWSKLRRFNKRNKHVKSNGRDDSNGGLLQHQYSPAGSSMTQEQQQQLRRHQHLLASRGNGKRPTLATAYSGSMEYSNTSQKSLYSYATSTVAGSQTISSSMYSLGQQTYLRQQQQQYNASRPRMYSHGAQGENESLFNFSLDGYTANNDDTTTFTDFSYDDTSSRLRPHDRNSNVNSNNDGDDGDDDQFIFNKTQKHHPDPAADGGHQESQPFGEISYEESTDCDDQVSFLGLPTGSTIGTTSPMVGGFDLGMTTPEDQAGVQLQLPTNLMKMPTLLNEGHIMKGRRSTTSPTQRTDDEPRDPPPAPVHNDHHVLRDPAGFKAAAATSKPFDRRKGFESEFSSIWASKSHATSTGAWSAQPEQSTNILVSTRGILESLEQRYFERKVEAPAGELGIACRRKVKKQGLLPEEQCIVVDAMDEDSPLSGAVRPGDVILELNGKATSGMSAVQFSRLLLESRERPRSLLVQTDTIKSQAYDYSLRAGE